MKDVLYSRPTIVRLVRRKSAAADMGFMLRATPDLSTALQFILYANTPNNDKVASIRHHRVYPSSTWRAMPSQPIDQRSCARNSCSKRHDRVDYSRRVCSDGIHSVVLHSSVDVSGIVLSVVFSKVPTQRWNLVAGRSANPLRKSTRPVIVRIFAPRRWRCRRPTLIRVSLFLITHAAQRQRSTRTLPIG